jgi:hypothetical protein
MPTERLTGRERMMLALLASGLVVVLAVALWLTPDPSGTGTHQQLGLPPCTSITVLGLRCPACGMTTSWALMSEGRIAEALAANIGGSLLYVIAILSTPWLWYIVWTGSMRSRDQWGMFALGGCLTSMFIALVLWAWNFVSIQGVP